MSEEFRATAPWMQEGREEEPPEGETPEAVSKEPAPSLPTPEECEAIRQKAFREGFERGLREGRAKGEAILQGIKEKARTQAALLDSMLEGLARPLEELDEAVEKELLLLATAIARQLVRREIKTDPGQILAVVKEALEVLPVSHREVRVCLHPEDASLVAEAFPEGERLWQIREDPTLSRGGCRVLTETSQVDATVEKRLGAVIARVLGTRDQDL